MVACTASSSAHCHHQCGCTRRRFAVSPQIAELVIGREQKLLDAKSVSFYLRLCLFRFVSSLTQLSLSFLCHCAYNRPAHNAGSCHKTHDTLEIPTRLPVA